MSINLLIFNSMGAAVVLQVAIRHPEIVRKLVFASISYKLDGLHPGLMEGLLEMKPEMMVGSPWHEEYMRIAPRPEDFDHHGEMILLNLSDYAPSCLGTSC